MVIHYAVRLTTVIHYAVRLTTTVRAIELFAQINNADVIRLGYSPQSHHLAPPIRLVARIKFGVEIDDSRAGSELRLPNVFTMNELSYTRCIQLDMPFK